MSSAFSGSTTDRVTTNSSRSVVTASNASAYGRWRRRLAAVSRYQAVLPLTITPGSRRTSRTSAFV